MNNVKSEGRAAANENTMAVWLTNIASESLDKLTWLIAFLSESRAASGGEVYDQMAIGSDATDTPNSAIARGRRP